MLGEFLALISAFVGASSTIFAAKALRKVGPVRSNALKTIFAAVFMVPIAFAAGEMNDLTRLNLHGAALVISGGVIGHAIGDTVLFKSVTATGVSRAYTLCYTYPLFTMIIAVIFLGESFSIAYLTGTILMVLSITLVMTEKGESHRDISSKNLLMAIATAVLWAVGISMIALGLRSISVLLAQALRFPILALLLFALSQPRKKWNLDKQCLLFLSLSGFLGMILSGFAFLSSVRLIGASKATPLNASSPIWASIMSAFILKEKVTPRLILSATTVVVGIFFFTK